jgi:hypothetical protein
MASSLAAFVFSLHDRLHPFACHLEQLLPKFRWRIWLLRKLHTPARKFQNQLLTTWHKLHRVPFVQPDNAHYGSEFPNKHKRLNQPFCGKIAAYVGNHTGAEFIEFGGSGGVPMPSSKEYWLHAQQCLELAKEAEDFYVKSALIELAEKFKKQAEKIKDR